VPAGQFIKAGGTQGDLGCPEYRGMTASVLVQTTD